MSNIRALWKLSDLLGTFDFVWGQLVAIVIFSRKVVWIIGHPGKHVTLVKNPLELSHSGLRAELYSSSRIEAKIHVAACSKARFHYRKLDEQIGQAECFK